MFRAVSKPRVAVLGLSLELYERAIPGYMPRLAEQLGRFVEPFRPAVEPTNMSLCCTSEHAVQAIAQAERDNVDALLLVPLSYAASLMTLPGLLNTSLPIVIWNTQEAREFGADYCFDDLLMNHVAQGTQDLTNVLLRSGRTFGMESGHCRDTEAIGRVVDWLMAARAMRYARTIRVGLLGRPFQDMGDFAMDETAMAERWGPRIVRLDISELAKLAAAAPMNEIDAAMRANREVYAFAPQVDEAMHRTSAGLAWAVRQLVQANQLDAFTMNFLEVIADGRCATLPFLGVNQLIGEGLGYAGEGDVVTAAHMAQMRQLCGAANFTEMFTVDYERNRMLMMHMQECNPAMARRDRRVRLVRKDFWAPGVQPYVGMYFTLEPGPVTLAAISADGEGRLYYVAHETLIVDMEPLARLDVPHWVVQLDGPVGGFLTDYSMAGGPHHLVAVPGHMLGRLEKLATWQAFELRVV